MTIINEVISGARSDTEFLVSMARNHQNRLLASIRKLRDNITSLVSQLETTPAGKLEGVKVNLKQSQALHKKIVNQFEKDYNKDVNKMLGDFSSIEKLIQRRYRALNESIGFVGADKTMMDALKLNTYNRYVEFGEAARNRIARAMYDSVVGGQKFSSLVNTIQGVLTGHKDVLGRPMTMYAQGFAQDAVMNFHNQVNIKKGKDAGLRHFLYYGNLMATSRQFCITRVGKVYTERQINSWDGLSWQGKAGPALTDRGGYNCRHHWRPVRKEWLLDDDQNEISREEVLGEIAAAEGDKISSRHSLMLSDKRKSLADLEKKKLGLKDPAKIDDINNEIEILKKEIDSARIELSRAGVSVRSKALQEKARKVLPARKPPPGAPPIDDTTKSFVGKVKYYVKNGRPVGQGSKMFIYWDAMDDAAKKYYIDLWTSEGIDVTKYKHLFPKGGIAIPPVPKAPPVPKPKPKVKPKAGPPGTIDSETKKGIGKVKYYVKNGKSVGQNSKMYQSWLNLTDDQKTYYIDLWTSEGIDVTGYSHLWPGAAPPPAPPVPKPKPPIVKPKPKKPKIPAKKQKQIDELYKTIDWKLTELNEVIELTPLAKQSSFEELMLNLERRLALIEEIQQINNKLISLGATARPLPTGINIPGATIKKIVDTPISTTIIDKQQVLKDKLRKYGIQNIGDYGHEAFDQSEWLEAILEPLAKELDRLSDISPLLIDNLSEVNIAKLEMYKARGLSQLYHPTANGLYRPWAKEMAVASRTEKALAQLEKSIDIGGGAWSVSSEAQSAISTFRHELGHHVHDNMLRYTPTWEEMKMYRKWDDIWNRKGPDWFKSNVTMYSGTNDGEAFAEAFAAYFSPKYRRGMLPDIIEEFFDELSTGISKGYNYITYENTLVEAADIMKTKLAADVAEAGARGRVLADISKPMKRIGAGYTRVGDEWYDGSKKVSDNIAKKLNKLRIPPAWTEVLVSKDPKSNLVAVGKDDAGRWQYKYSAKHVKKASKKKFDRVKLFAKRMPAIRKKIEAGIKKNIEAAWLLELEDLTAIRIGTDRDFRAKIRAYGLTTLQAEHVSIQGNKIILDFTAKKGTHAHYELKNERMANWLRSKKIGKRRGDKLFDTNASQLNAYLKKIGGSKYSVKDFRTYHGTRIAYDLLKQYTGIPLSRKEKKRIVKEVVESVSRFLYNTPAIARSSYIDPMVWELIGGI